MDVHDGIICMDCWELVMDDFEMGRMDEDKDRGAVVPGTVRGLHSGQPPNRPIGGHVRSFGRGKGQSSPSPRFRKVL